MCGNIVENMYTDVRVERVKILCGNGDRAKFSYKPRVEEIQPEQFLDRDRPHWPISSLGLKVPKKRPSCVLVKSKAERPRLDQS